jgi:hypothetical protein
MPQSSFVLTTNDIHIVIAINHTSMTVSRRKGGGVRLLRIKYPRPGHTAIGGLPHILAGIINGITGISRNEVNIVVAIY